MVVPCSTLVYRIRHFANLLTDVLPDSELNKSIDPRVTLAVRHLSTYCLLEYDLLLSVMNHFGVVRCGYCQSQRAVLHADHGVRLIHLDGRMLLMLSMWDTLNADGCDDDDDGVDILVETFVGKNSK